jgi:hypothetical protein
MAVYGLGATYGGTEDQSHTFIKLGIACIGWTPSEAPAAHAQMASLKVGDIIFIKSFVPTTGLHIKAVGIVTDASFRKITDALGWGVSVRWVSEEPERIAVGSLSDRSDYMRRGTIYEEFNPDVIRRVIDKLLQPQSEGADSLPESDTQPTSNIRPLGTATSEELRAAASQRRFRKEDLGSAEI